jgi:hypothetical protein
MDKLKTNDHLLKNAVSKSVCEHIMCRNPKEHQENKCRLCGKPYKTVC